MTELTVEALAEQVKALEERVKAVEEKTTDEALAAAVTKRQRMLST